ncbi:MAG: TerB family tellurite resistance protein [Flavobacteriales bacterium]|nr:TerB family tellurite resistance protein [Flavobacteriales bacterium]
MENIFNKFKKEVNTEMSFEEFQILILIYPVFLVAIADGTFDNEEKEFIKEILLNFLRPLYKDEINDEQYEILVLNYLDDLTFLNQNKVKYDTDFLTVLSTFDLEIKNSISELLNDVANASGGLSEEENQVIETLKMNYLS